MKNTIVCFLFMWTCVALDQRANSAQRAIPAQHANPAYHANPAQQSVNSFQQRMMMAIMKGCYYCRMCSLGLQFCGYCKNNTQGVCKFCAKTTHCRTTCVTICGYSIKNISGR